MAKSIIDLCIYLKKNENTIAVSSILPRSNELNNKTDKRKTNDLELLCKKGDLLFTYHCETIDPKSILAKVIFISNFMALELLQKII